MSNPLRYKPANSVHQAALSKAFCSFALRLAVCAQVRCFTMCFYSCGGSCNADEWPIVKRHEMSWILNNGHPWAMIHQVYQWINLKKSYALGRIENWDASGHLGSCRPPKLLPTTPCHIGADRIGSRFYIQPTKRHNNEKGHLHDFLLHICSFLWSVSSALLLGHKIRLCCNTSRLSLNYIETERRKKNGIWRPGLPESVGPIEATISWVLRDGLQDFASKKCLALHSIQHQPELHQLPTSFILGSISLLIRLKDYVPKSEESDLFIWVAYNNGRLKIWCFFFQNANSMW